MAKQVTVLGLEGDTLRGIRLDAVDDGFVRGPVASWPLVTEESGDASSAEDEFAVEGDDAAATEAVVEEDKPLARAFRAAAETFDTHEVVLSLPLSRLLVKTVSLPAEAREDVLGAAQLELDGISPFPDEVLTPAVEIMAETEKEIVAVVAALPEAACMEIGEALAAAKVTVVRTDATAFAWLRGLWPRLCEKENAARRLVLLNLDEGWDVVVLADGAPSFMRGLGVVAGAAELGREIMLSLLSQSVVQGDADDVVVCSRTPPAADVLARLADFGPVRTVLVEDDFVGVEGAARRTIEGSTLDVTPATWVEAREESRFLKKMKVGLSIAGGIWLIVMAALFGVDTAYDFMAGYQKRQQKEAAHANAYKKVRKMKDRVLIIERYTDHARSALSVLKAVSDSLPDSEKMAFRDFQYRRNESVRVSGTAGEFEELRTFEDNLDSATFGDEDEKLFAKVQPGDENSRKAGVSFDITCFFHDPEEDVVKEKGKKR